MWHGAAITSPEVRRINTGLCYYEVLIGGTFTEEFFGERYGFGARLYLVHAMGLVDPGLSSQKICRLRYCCLSKQEKDKEGGTERVCVLTWMLTAAPTEKNLKRRVLSAQVPEHPQ